MTTEVEEIKRHLGALVAIAAELSALNAHMALLVAAQERTAIAIANSNR
jgi:hypothetical protein